MKTKGEEIRQVAVRKWTVTQTMGHSCLLVAVLSHLIHLRIHFSLSVTVFICHVFAVGGQNNRNIYYAI